MSHERAFIDGQWIETAATLAVLDPGREERIATVPACGRAEIDRAVTAASRAQPDWAARSAVERAGFLRRIADALDADTENLAELETRDNGKPLAESRLDVADAIYVFRYYADLVEAQPRDEAVALPDARFDCRVRRMPVGVVGQVIPWNYPLLMAAWKVAPALAAGCAAVLKPSELTPLTALRLAAAAEASGLPAGVLNVVTGTGAAAGAPLVADLRVRKLAFTGSVPTGSAIARAAAPEIKRVSLELGGKSPMIVFSDADLDAAVEWILFGIFWNQGEVCSATSRLLVERPIHDALVERVIAAASRIRIGYGLDPASQLGPLVSAVQRDRVQRFVRNGIGAGARLLAGGSVPAEQTQGFFFSPTIVDRLDDKNPLWTEEIFGPVLAVRSFDREDEALRLANNTRFGLAAAVMSADEDRCERVADALDAGIVWINCSQPTFTEAPWGGTKQSGIGRELGRWGLEQYQELKQITRWRSREPWGWYA
jgi:betaine-aldehyde dehydrogenase